MCVHKDLYPLLMRSFPLCKPTYIVVWVETPKRSEGPARACCWVIFNHDKQNHISAVEDERNVKNADASSG